MADAFRTETREWIRAPTNQANSDNSVRHDLKVIRFFVLLKGYLALRTCGRVLPGSTAT